ncbi:MAG: site-specific DNA-methyltransferase [Candidatus Kryptonium sp.]|nr:site-specific DNA-methyltransferase [Candidatus Kryptonium sp.]
MAKKTREYETIVGFKERKFFETLKNIFIGVPVEGESGYINLMRIKAKYFERVMEPHLRSEIDEALNPFPNFREELFDKLYTFFKRYFTESGSIGFFFTPYHQSVYERVYTDERDVMLFWKTARLYYVKTDRLFRSMEVSLDGFRFFFDVSTLEHKKANEKRELVFTFKERRSDGVFVFTVAYSERGSKTNIQEIRRAIKDALGLKNYTDAVPTEETLERAFRLFERQSEVDYFICKDAKSFLREQFDLWMWQYLLGKPGEEPQTEWTEERIKQLQALKRIAYRVIDFIAAFEDELVRIWNKPKFVLRSNYVITLDRIHERCPELIERIIAHPRFHEQVKEWQDLGMVDENFNAESIYETNLEGKHLHPRYRFLPIDTRYFKDLELQILAIFDNLDEALDGWLIKSENYQALKTILPKFKGKVQTIYIDPPFNKEQDADYHYSVKYKDATWITLLENRLRLARELLKDTGSIFVRCDYNGNMFVRLLMDQMFEFKNEIVINRTQEFFKFAKGLNKFMVDIDTLLFYAKTDESVFHEIRIRRNNEQWWEPFLPGEAKSEEDRFRIVLGQKIEAPKGRKWGLKQSEINELEKMGRIKIDEKGRVKYAPLWTTLKNNWTDIPGYSRSWQFLTENAEILLKRVIECSSDPKDLVMDFFLGSGTTCAVAHKLKRKWLGVEMGEHFWTVVLPRMKKVLAYDPSGISKEKDVAEKYNQRQAGGFFKYYELEQYEDTLRRTRYQDDDLFAPPATEDPCQYIFLRDLKMLEALEVNLEQGTVKLDLSKLYDNIDLAETLSNLTGKWIKRIHPDPDDPTKPSKMEFEDGTTIDLKNPDWQLIKPLIWWGSA